jgi:hypothetical protein
MNTRLNTHPIVRRVVLLVAPAALLVGLSAGSASAKDGDVKVKGTCSAGSTWKLKAGVRDSGIESEFEVDSNKVGQVWSVRMTDNGTQVFAGNRTTVAPSGSFSISRHFANRTGTDTIVATATNARTGETCSGTVAI